MGISNRRHINKDGLVFAVDAKLQKPNDNVRSVDILG